MRFRVVYQVGSNIREDIIEADNLESAEKRADQKYRNWIDVVHCDYAKSEVA